LAHRVMVTGMGVVSPAGIGKQTFWQNLLEGKSYVRNLGKDFFPFELPDGENPIGATIEDFSLWKEIRQPILNLLADRAVQFALVAIKHARRDAGLRYARGTRDVGLFVATVTGGINTSFDTLVDYYSKPRPRLFSRRFAVGFLPGYWAYLISSYLKTGGPTTVVGTSCHAGSEGIGACYRAIRDGEVRVGFAVGTDAPLVYNNYLSFRVIGAMAEAKGDASRVARAFCRGRSGMVFGEGAAALVLESEESAVARGATILGEIAGYGAGVDGGESMVQPDDQGKGLERSIVNALRKANCQPAGVDAICAHGTGTRFNDRTETRVIKRVFGDHAREIPVFSLKPMLGHSFGGAGAIETCASLLALQHQVLPPTVNYDEQDEECDLDYVPNTPRRQPLSTILKTGLGFGGTNLALVLRASGISGNP
jgi:3-oxoacyl-[acyl-carrier-protein] synthase II